MEDDAIAAAEEEMSHTRAREKEELVAFALFIADIYWLRNLRRKVRSVTARDC